MPSPSEELPPSEAPFVTFWARTHLGTAYYLPDMLEAHIDQVRRQLDMQITSITLRNISDVVMVIPKHILKTAGANDRCFWEAP